MAQSPTRKNKQWFSTHNKHGWTKQRETYRVEAVQRKKEKKNTERGTDGGPAKKEQVEKPRKTEIGKVTRIKEKKKSVRNNSDNLRLLFEQKS